MDMVAKIMKSAPGVFAVLGYNESKLEDEDAVLVAFENMDFEGEDCIPRTFARRERIAHSEDAPKAFHMVLSPGDGEEWDDWKLQRFVGRMMSGLGFGSQPYAIYRHEDTQRQHWHVVPTWVKEDSYRVSDSYIYRRCSNLAKQLAPEFGYVYGAHRGVRKNRFGILQFNPAGEGKKGQLLRLFNDALEYRFTSFEQFVQILRVMGVSVKERTGLQTRLVLQGLDEMGKPCTGEFTEKMLGLDLYGLYSRRARECLKTFDVWKDNRQRVLDLCTGPIRESAGMKQMRRLARAGKIDFTLRRAPSSRRICSGDFIDHQTRCAFSLADFGHGSGLGLDSVRDADENRWDHREDSSPDGHVTLGDLLAGLSQGTSRSQEKDPKDDRRRRRRKGVGL